MSSVFLYKFEMLRQYFHIFSSCNPSANLRIKFINSPAAACLHIISLIPLNRRYEKQRQNHICHKHIVSPIPPATITGNKLAKIKILSSVCDSHYKEHDFLLSKQVVFFYQPIVYTMKLKCAKTSAQKSDRITPIAFSIFTIFYPTSAIHPYSFSTISAFSYPFPIKTTWLHLSP